MVRPPEAGLLALPRTPPAGEWEDVVDRCWCFGAASGVALLGGAEFTAGLLRGGTEGLAGAGAGLVVAVAVVGGAVRGRPTEDNLAGW